jgi:hypothetical protein
MRIVEERGQSRLDRVRIAIIEHSELLDELICPDRVFQIGGDERRQVRYDDSSSSRAAPASPTLIHDKRIRARFF